MADNARVFNLFRLLVLTLSLADQAHSFFYNHHYHEYHYIQKLEKKLNALERKVTDSLERIGDLEEVVTDLARQECETGAVNIVTCPGFDEATQTEITVCVSAPIAGVDPIIQTFDIPFGNSFVNPPVVKADISGQAFLLGKNCSVEVTSVSSDSVRLTYVADDIFPIAVQLSWYACPSALFGPGEGLPEDD